MEENKKYGITNEVITYYGNMLRRIVALKDFGDVSTGDLGGYVQSEDNLSQKGNCWIYNTAKVYDNAKIFDNARVINNAQINGTANIFEESQICNDAIISQRAQIYGNSLICGTANIKGNANIYGHALVSDYIVVDSDTIIRGNARVVGRFRLPKNTIIGNSNDYIPFKTYDGGDNIVWTKSNKLCTGPFFSGTFEGLISEGYRESEEAGRYYEYCRDFVEKVCSLRK